MVCHLMHFGTCPVLHKHVCKNRERKCPLPAVLSNTDKRKKRWQTMKWSMNLEARLMSRTPANCLLCSCKLALLATIGSDSVRPLPSDSVVGPCRIGIILFCRAHSTRALSPFYDSRRTIMYSLACLSLLILSYYQYKGSYYPPLNTRWRGGVTQVNTSLRWPLMIEHYLEG